MEWVELRAHSYFSFLDGASSPEELAEAAARVEMAALGVTDHGGLYGAVRFGSACAEVGVRALFGAEVGVRDGASVVRVALLARDRRGWGNLCRLLSVAGQQRVDGAPVKGRGVLGVADLEGRTDGLVVLTGGLEGALAGPLLASETACALGWGERLRELFGRDGMRVEIWRHADRREELVRGAVLELASRLGVKVVATNGTRYASAEGRRLADVMACIRGHRTLDGAGTLLRASDRWGLPPPREMAERFADLPEAVRNAGELAQELELSLAELSFAVPEWGGAAAAYAELYRLVQQGAAERYRPIGGAAARQVAHELEVIRRMELAGYFLLVWDVVRFCRERGIGVQGRGSAANSAVCYCLGITAVDPVRLSLLFERFLSAERGQPPDIDLDIAHEDREEVIQYVYRRHGREHAGMVAEVICYRAKLAVREVGKVLGFSLSDVDRIAACVGPWAPAGAIEKAVAEAGFEPRAPRMRLLSELCARLEGVPRHLGIHVGGMIVTASPLCELVPVEAASMADRTVIQWDKDDVAALGLAKIDLLGLGMLTVIGKAIRSVRERGIVIDPARLGYDEPEVYDMLCAADTVGVFQVESRAQMVTLPRLKPRTFYDLVIEVSLIRPGPIQGDMVHPYLRRRAGEEPVTYAHPSVEPVLARTLGVPLFQEQGMRVAVAAAGFSAGEADELRRAMGAKRSVKKMQALTGRLRDGMLARGFTAAAADTIIHQLTAFANYGFPESHAASFALLVYVSAHLKRYFPAEFTCALLNSQPMGFYAPATLLADARRHGVEILPVDLGTSAWDCTLVRDGAGPDAPVRLQLGLRLVKGLGDAAHERLAAERARGPFTSVEDVVARAGLAPAVLERLAAIGCFASFGLQRRDAIWQLTAACARHDIAHAPYAPDAPVLLPPEAWPPLADDRAPLPPMSPLEVMAADYRSMSLSTGPHPLTLLREAVRARGGLDARSVTALGHRIGSGRLAKRKGPRVRVAGLVISRQGPPTAKGFIFLTLEDETGFANIIVQPRIVQRYRLEVMREPLLLVEGQLSIEGGTVNVIARTLESLALDDPSVTFRSRDFR